MKVAIRRVQEEDENIFTYFTTRLGKFNQINHTNNCLHGDILNLDGFNPKKGRRNL